MAQREIKFRAWRLLQGTHYMEYDALVSFDGEVWDEPRRTYNTPNREIGTVEVIALMQYTGLKDRNGKELYFNSDVVKLDDTPGLWSAVKDSYGIPHFAPPDDLYPTLRFEEYFIECENNIDAFEIIGNIYENPELLK